MKNRRPIEAYVRARAGALATSPRNRRPQSRRDIGKLPLALLVLPLFEHLEAFIHNPSIQAFVLSPLERLWGTRSPCHRLNASQARRLLGRGGRRRDQPGRARAASSTSLETAAGPARSRGARCFRSAARHRGNAREASTPSAAAVISRNSQSATITVAAEPWRALAVY